MCYSNSSTSKNVDLAKKYGKKFTENLPEEPVYFSSGFSFPEWRIITSKEEIQQMYWGLIPHWFKDADPNKMAAMTLNAKIESAHEKASFRSSIGKRNCIIPSSGFFEWHTKGKEKIPYFIRPALGELFSMAGIYDEWVDRSTGELISTFSLLTCPANEVMEQIHNTKKRMPVLLAEEQFGSWLSGELSASILSSPTPSEWLSTFTVSKKLILSDQPNVPEIQMETQCQLGLQGSLF